MTEIERATRDVIDAAVEFVMGDPNDPWGYGADTRLTDLEQAVRHYEALRRKETTA